jgi:rhodanese-related sulfurtransferase
VNELLAEARSRLQRLEPTEAMAALRDGALIVDLRSHDERARHGVIPGSLHVPRSVLEWRLDPVSPYRNPAACDLERHVVLVCADGYSSSLAAATLQDLGFARATDLVGGFTAWKALGLPVGRAGPAAPEPLGMGGPEPGAPEARLPL